MADRYQDRPFPAREDDRGGDPHASARAEGDPLAELARLIGQTDPLGSMGRANQPVQPRPSVRAPYRQPVPQQPAPREPDNGPPAGPPPWMQRAARQEIPQQDYTEDHPRAGDYPNAARPLQRYATPHAAPEPDYHHAPPFADADQEADPSRYDDALYGRLDPGAQESEHDPVYADDLYYQDSDLAEGQVIPKRRGGMITVVIVLALAVVGTGAAFAYRTYVG